MKTTAFIEYSYQARRSFVPARQPRWVALRECLFKAAIALLLLLAVSMTSGTARAQLSDIGGKRDVTVITRNVFVGAEFSEITALDPRDPLYLPKLVEAVTTAYYTIVVSNDFRVRAPGIAQEIAATRPDLIGLQEISLVRKQSPGDLVIGGTTPATEVVIDFLQVLLAALLDRGAYYTVASIVTNWDVELPALNMGTGQLDDVRLTDYDVILARTDLPAGYLMLWNAQAGNFTNNLVIPSIGLEFRRGWCSVDAFVRGRIFRFVTTHLEVETAPVIQQLQAEEILGDPASGALPVILVGDLNSDANGQNGTVTYGDMLDAGFTDAWSAVYPGNPGLTWGHDPALADPGVPFVWRYDLILFRYGTFVPAEAAILNTSLLRDEPPLWPSDHAGVVGRFWLE